MRIILFALVKLVAVCLGSIRKCSSTSKSFVMMLLIFSVIVCRGGQLVKTTGPSKDNSLHRSADATSKFNVENKAICKQ